MELIMIKECENYMNKLAEIFIINEGEEHWTMIRVLELIKHKYLVFQRSELREDKIRVFY